MKKIFFLMIGLFFLSVPPSARAKVYIDISSPERKLPIALSPFAGPLGKEVVEVAAADLDYTGLFTLLDEKGFSEPPHEPFRRENWLPTGVACVAKGRAWLDKSDLEIMVSLYDVLEGKEIYRKRYRAPKGLVRPLGHNIADDIYRELAGSKGTFKSRLAYLTEKEGVKDIFIADWDGGRVKEVGLRERILMPPRWTRDGGSLLYSAERKRRWSVFLLDLRAKKERLVIGGPGTNLAGDVNQPGDIVFSSTQEGSPDIYILKADRTLRRLTSDRGIEVSPSFQPAGEKIAFVSDRSGSPQIYIMDSSGYNIARSTFKGGYNTSPSWHPEGERIVFAGRYSGKNQVFTARADGSETVMLTDRGNNEEPAFSPDGRFIVFSSDRDGHKAVYMMRANGEAQKRISPAGVKAFGPRWSGN
jgi:TolB protein